MSLELMPAEWPTTILIPVLSALGAVGGILAKDFFFPLSLESLKERRALEHTYRRYKDPLVVSAAELAHRLNEITSRHPVNYLCSKVLDNHPAKQLKNDDTDPYFMRHKLMSTLYRFCSFFGWLELYRQEITFLNSGNERHAREMEIATNFIRSDMADGHINTHTDWIQWRDTLIFREELRAIGEAMIDTTGPTQTVIAYGKFLQLLDSKTENATKRWTEVVMNFVLDPETDRDFRKARMDRLLVHLISLIDLMEPRYVGRRLADAQRRALASPYAWPEGPTLPPQPKSMFDAALLSLSA